jgi:tRNA modification GTPase
MNRGGMKADQMLEDTIIAVSTPPGCGGLGVVRLSGSEALRIARKFFRPRRMKWRELPARVLVFGDIRDGEKKVPVDEAFLVFFAAPQSYTRENVVEISCHGSPVVLDEVVRLGTRAGARLAHPGEFTLRAYLRGRLDLIQAEAVNDLIEAASLAQAKISLGQLRGGLSRQIGAIRSEIVDLMCLVESGIEFPEEGLGIGAEEGVKRLEALILAARKLASSYEAGKAMTEGLDLAIIGRANVGKSTLFNALLDQERAIVSPYPGTTRDYLREMIKINDVRFHLVDTAGLEKPGHPVEKEGVRRSEEMASRADGILMVIDSSRKESPADLELIQRFNSKKMILVFSKADLSKRADKRKCLAPARNTRWVEVSAKTGKGLEELRGALHDNFSPKKGEDEEVILHLRQKVCFDEIASGLEKALDLLRKGHTDEVWSEEIRGILPLIGQLTGEIGSEEVISGIFSRFCVGK